MTSSQPPMTLWQGLIHSKQPRPPPSSQDCDSAVDISLLGPLQRDLPSVPRYRLLTASHRLLTGSQGANYTNLTGTCLMLLNSARCKLTHESGFCICLQFVSLAHFCSPYLKTEPVCAKRWKKMLVCYGESEEDQPLLCTHWVLHM